MARHCTVCSHPDRHLIDQECLDRGESVGGFGAIAERYGLSKSAVVRHGRPEPEGHIPAGLGILSRRLGVIDHETLLGEAATIYERSLGVLAKLEADSLSGNGKVKATDVISALREVRSGFETLAKLSFTSEDRSVPQADTVNRPNLDARISDALTEALKRRRGEATEDAVIVDSAGPIDVVVRELPSIT